MAQLNNIAMFSVFLIVPMLIVVGSMKMALKRANENQRRNPLTKGMLRGPGHHLREQIEDLRVDVIAMPLFAAYVPAIMFLLTSMDKGVSGLRPIHWATVMTVSVLAVGFAVRVMYHQIIRLRDLRLGFEAETAAGQELNLLMKDGFSVFHDVSGDKKFNIDHVVVGRQGVFAVETKGRSKPMNAAGGDGHKVRFDGQQLLFPGWSETEPIDQAKRNAEWLRKWLSSAVGEPVDVRPVLMLPGWFIERTSGDGIPVLAGTNCRNFFLKAGRQTHSDKLVQQIVHQLDTRCRDVEPRAYVPLKE